MKRQSGRSRDSVLAGGMAARFRPQSLSGCSTRLKRFCDFAADLVMGPLWGSVLASVCIVFVFCTATAIASPAQTFTILANFDGTNGESPSDLIQGGDGNFYGTTTSGGANGYGTVFKVSPTSTLTTLHSFNDTDGSYPLTGLVQGSDGNFYGTTYAGGAKGYGTVFKITPGGTLTTLHSFNNTDGSYPQTELVQGTDGNFYGTTTDGGTYGFGTVFKTTPGGTLTTLHSFNDADGSYPQAELLQGTDGSFYGTTEYGGANDDGTVFKITPVGTLTTLHSFNNTDGSFPQTGLVQGTDGNFYGTTEYGGDDTDCVTLGCGTVFRITPAGTLTTLHTFDGADGENPSAKLMQGTDGNFYGTTVTGGASSNCDDDGQSVYGCGTVFTITPGGTLTTLHSFAGYSADGAKPYGRLVQATDGNFYGTTYGENYNCANDINGCGTVFGITPGGTLTTLHRFQDTDGANPFVGLIQATDGNLYGTTYQGGGNQNCFNGCGTVFSLDVGLGTIVETLTTSGEVGATVIILGRNLTGTTSVSFNGVAATFTVVSASQITTTVPTGATTGTVEVITPSGTFTSNVVFQVLGVAVSVATFGSGTVTSGDGNIICGSTCWYRYTNGTPVTLTAAPSPGWRLVGWTGCDSVNGAKCQLAMNSDRNVTASFAHAAQDFNGDFVSDILWRNTLTGQNGIWLMNGFSFASAAAIYTVADVNWQIAGTGDFDGDGKADILWRNLVTGQIGIWFMNGTTLANPVALSYVVSDLNWQVIAITDFDGDGKADILWRNTATGDIALWLMNGANFTAAQIIYRITDLNWRVAGTGDFDGDGKADIFWRNSVTGQNAVWLMNGFSIVGAAATYQVSDVNWRVAAIGDFDGDGKSDILWFNKQSGKLAMWFMNGLTYSSATAFSQAVDPSWYVVRAGDFNGDGKADILWRNQINGENAIWLMNGATLKSGQLIYTVSDLNWKMY